MMGDWMRMHLLPPGKYKLGTLVISVKSGTPSLAFAAGTCYFTPCLGKTYSAEIRLGKDWFDADTLAFSGRVNSAPTLSEIPWLAVREGETLDQVVEATDPDGQTLRLAAVGVPGYMTLTTTSSRRGKVRGVIHVAPDFCSAGVFPIKIT